MEIVYSIIQKLWVILQLEGRESQLSNSHIDLNSTELKLVWILEGEGPHLKQLISRSKKRKKTGFSSMVEHILTSMCEALGLIPSTKKRKRRLIGRTNPGRKILHNLTHRPLAFNTVCGKVSGPSSLYAL